MDKEAFASEQQRSNDSANAELTEQHFKVTEQHSEVAEQHLYARCELWSRWWWWELSTPISNSMREHMCTENGECHRNLCLAGDRRSYISLMKGLVL